ncbi:glycosyltransferase [Azospirillum sp. YIM B02556]|uniref:Glycosyltransferase n=1 Tax=Azospirillum endophyticum TaxID=2800326 RepID=A0ABS1EY48_9PROT|nr:glycosyltransferase [Azospirillum endophyticum]MBK1836044.1 glycosyltransferase [Azospirillum endophyticum]
MHGMQDDTQLLDCIVRFHDIRRLAELERCVFSLVGQRYRPLNIVLVLQRFSPAEVAATEAGLAPLLQLPGAPSLTVRNWNQDGIADARTHLLNCGVEAARGRYLAFLDYDDLLFPEAYELLAAQLRDREAAIAFASVQVMQVEVRDRFFRTIGPQTPTYRGRDLGDLFDHNFCPIHSYLIDRSKLPADLLRFDPTLTIEEDYDLLLRICAQHPADFSLIGTEIGYYVYKTDGSNTVGQAGGLDGEKLALYETVQRRIRERKEMTAVSVAIQAQLGLPHPRNGLSIQDLHRQLRTNGRIRQKLGELTGAR